MTELSTALKLAKTLQKQLDNQRVTPELRPLAEAATALVKSEHWHSDLHELYKEANWLAGYIKSCSGSYPQLEPCVATANALAAEIGWQWAR